MDTSCVVALGRLDGCVLTSVMRTALFLMLTSSGGGI